MHIVYLHQYFTPPDGTGSTRSYEMARRLVSAGHRVTLVTSNAFFPPAYNFTRFVSDIVIEGIELKVIRVAYSNRQSYLRRIFAFFQFALLAAIVAIKIRGVDLVFATSTPLTIMLPGIAVKWRHRVPMVFEVRDQWPAVPIALGILKNPLAVSAARWMEQTAYKHSKHIIALSPATRDGIAAVGITPDSITVIPNCSDTDLFRIPAAQGDEFLCEFPHLKDKKIVAYAGTLGFANGVDYIVRLAASIIHLDPNICFVIAGDGAKRDQLRILAYELGVYGRNFWILSPLPKTQVPRFLAAATAVCSTFVAEAAPWPNSANKFFDGMAAGKPVIINYLGWQKNVLDCSGAGLALPLYDFDRAAKILQAFLGDEIAVAKASAASALLAETQYNRTFLANKLRSVLEHTAASTRKFPDSQSTTDRNDRATPLPQGEARKSSLFQQRQ
jgi:glycosyltransferase involved in cell wall biosynthesis